MRTAASVVVAALFISGCAAGLSNAASIGSGARSVIGARPSARREIGGGWEAQTFLISSLQITEEKVACTTGKVNSGGWSAGMTVSFASRPTDDESGWLVEVLPLTLDVQNALTVFAHCGSPAPHWQSQNIVAEPAARTIFHCPSSEQAYAGGWGSASGAQMVGVGNRPSSDDTQWSVTMAAFMGKGGTATAYADCIDSTGASFHWYNQAATIEGVTPASISCPGGKSAQAVGWGAASGTSDDAIPLIAAPNANATAALLALVPSADKSGEDDENVYGECG